MRLILLHTGDVVGTQQTPTQHRHTWSNGWMDGGGGRPTRRLHHTVTGYCSDSGIKTTSWTQIAQDVPTRYRIVEEGTEVYMLYMTTWTKERHAEGFFAVLPLEFLCACRGPPEREGTSGCCLAVACFPV